MQDFDFKIINKESGEVITEGTSIQPQIDTQEYYDSLEIRIGIKTDYKVDKGMVQLMGQEIINRIKGEDKK